MGPIVVCHLSPLSLPLLRSVSCAATLARACAMSSGHCYVGPRSFSGGPVCTLYFPDDHDNSGRTQAIADPAAALLSR
jgi:hypothetical protein